MGTLASGSIRTRPRGTCHESHAIVVAHRGNIKLVRIRKPVVDVVVDCSDDDFLICSVVGVVEIYATWDYTQKARRAREI